MDGTRGKINKVAVCMGCGGVEVCHFVRVVCLFPNFENGRKSEADLTEWI